MNDLSSLGDVGRLRIGADPDPNLLPVSSPLVVDGWGAASIANPARPNQDRFGADGTLFSIADGVGGLAKGAWAATVAVRSFHASGARDPDALASALFAANTAVRALSRQLGTASGSTLSGVLATDAGIWVVHVGDTRLSWVEDGELRALTVDDNLAADLEADDPRRARLASQLTASLGQDVVLDRSAVTVPIPLHEARRLVLSSDGVHDILSTDEMGVAVGDPDPSSAAFDLVASAVRKGGRDHDDSTALVFDVSTRFAPRS